MQVIKGLDKTLQIQNSIVTQGTFDGVHTGHLKILKSIVELASAKNCKSVLLTFNPHPRQILQKDDNSIKLLTTFEEKTELLKNTGLDFLVVIPFDKQFSELSAEDFIKKILVEKIGVDTIVVGYDHRFGKNREGKFDDLKEFAQKYNFHVKEIAAFDIEMSHVSSTKIRNSLLHGDIETANKFLGRKYFLSGVVYEGNKLGKTIGFPTANIKVENIDKLIPANGVYAVEIEIENELFGGMMNIGNRPSIKGAKWSIEVNIFDFDKDIYGKKITVYFLSKMRDEKKFDNLEDLKIQLENDKRKALQLLKIKNIGY
ncbi:MAG: bifunctional riboflavin kinase/FAD synthetase [Bacteroidetes bacterium]|nr:bifunctional riboflavin kinase/FAD synthetase [Bacteroidota bacterium]